MPVLCDCPLPSLFSDCVPLFAPHLAAQADERLAIAYFGHDGALIKLRLEGGTCPGAVAFPLRDVVRDVLDMDATGIALAHNHPSGIARPSPADLQCTREAAQFLRLVGIDLTDHLIFVESGHFSFRNALLL